MYRVRVVATGALVAAGVKMRSRSTAFCSNRGAVEADKAEKLSVQVDASKIRHREQGHSRPRGARTEEALPSCKAEEDDEEEVRACGESTAKLAEAPLTTATAATTTRTTTQQQQQPRTMTVDLPGAVTSLLEAVERRDVRTVRRLLRESPDFEALANTPNRDGTTALLVASRSKPSKESTAIVAALVAARADVDKADKLGRTPLHLASLAGNFHATRLLLAAGAEVKRGDTRRGATATHYAAAFARVDTVQALCEAATTGKTSAADARDFFGRSPLHWTALSAHRNWAQHSSCDVASALIAHGADARARDRTGATAAHTAARLGSTAFLRHLVDADEEKSSSGAGDDHHPRPPRRLLDESDNSGVTPLDISCAKYSQKRLTVRFKWPLGPSDSSVAITLPRPTFW